jgi:hypothetical protein
MKKNTQNPAPRKFKLLSDEEDRAITLAAMSDPDNPPWTDEEFAKIKKFYRFGDVMPKASDLPSK